MPRYVSVAAHAITPTADGTVAPGDPVTLTAEAAADYVDRGELLEIPETPAAPAKAPEPSKTAKETDQ